jgi:hypothetical protein
MGATFVKPLNTNDMKLFCLDLFNLNTNSEIMNVYFIQLRPKKYTNKLVSPKDLYYIICSLTDNYSAPNFINVEGSRYMYLFCVPKIKNIKNVISNYGYEGYFDEYKIDKYKYNDNYTCKINYDNSACFDLELTELIYP